MRDDLDLDAFQARLEAEQRELAANAEVRREGAATVELDQTRTGRLSRMDALQGQAMARASAARADERAQRLAAALRRLEEGEYGYCVRCDEAIGARRLDADPASLICIDCAAASER